MAPVVEPNRSLNKDGRLSAFFHSDPVNQSVSSWTKLDHMCTHIIYVVVAYTIIIIIIISTWSMTKYLLFYQLISIVASESDSVWTCNLTNTSQPSSFCKEITIPISVCTDDGIFDDNQRSQKGYNKQFSQCSTKSKRKNTCPNNPTRCKQDVFNKTTYCGAHDQTCSVSSSCLSYCYSDCYPCNSRSNCDTLVAFGIAAPPNTTCFSLGRGIIPHSKVIQLIQHASAASP